MNIGGVTLSCSPESSPRSERKPTRRPRCSRPHSPDPPAAERWDLQEKALSHHRHSSAGFTHNAVLSADTAVSLWRQSHTQAPTSHRCNKNTIPTTKLAPEQLNTSEIFHYKYISCASAWTFPWKENSSSSCIHSSTEKLFIFTTLYGGNEPGSENDILGKRKFYLPPVFRQNHSSLR